LPLANHILPRTKHWITQVGRLLSVRPSRGSCMWMYQ
jgi:hypothetical protein